MKKTVALNCCCCCAAIILFIGCRPASRTHASRSPHVAAVPATVSGDSTVVNIPKVPQGHPRVYVRPSDLPAIRAKLSDPAFARDWKTIRESADSAAPHQTAGAPLCNAFIYLVEGDKPRGRSAIEQTLRILPTSNDARVFDEPLHWAACVYDWCYGLLSDGEKQAFIRELTRIAGLGAPGYPAGECNAVVGHDTENWLLTGQLPAGVAIYDETPVMYDAAAKLFFNEFVPVRNYYYPSHAHHQGDHYTTRIIYDLGASWLFRRMGAGDVLSRDQQFIPYQCLYNILPNRRQFMRGDGTGDLAGGRRRTITMLAGSFYTDPRLLALADGDIFDRQLRPFHEVFEMLLRPAGIPPRGFDDLPLTKYFGPPINDMVARTGWSLGEASSDAVVLMRLGGTFFGNHQFRDMGTFQVYYHGALAIASGVYADYGTPHWKAYYHQTLAHNGLLIFDPNEPIDTISMANTGGQRIPNDGRDHPDSLSALQNEGYEMARATAHAFGPDPIRPQYSYIAGDITRAYTDKVSLVTRSMVTLVTGEPTCPAVLVVFDRVLARDPSFAKTWLLHTPQEPSIAGDMTTVIRDEGPYHGKMEVRTLLPESPQIRKIGGPGKDFWVPTMGRNLPASMGRPDTDREIGVGGWRVEVSPSTPSAPRADDLFLHVMTVMDSSVAAGPKVTRFGDGNVIGVRVLDRAVLFSSANKAQTEVDFVLPASSEHVIRILVCDLAPGYWRIACDGKEIAGRLPVSRAAGSAYFDGRAGRYALRRIDRAIPPDAPDLFWQNLATESRQSGAR